jgi:hypothetical protein
MSWAHDKFEILFVSFNERWVDQLGDEPAELIVKAPRAIKIEEQT